MKKNKANKIKYARVNLMLFLILSLVFIIPLSVAADTPTHTATKDSPTRGDVRQDCSFVPPLDVKSSFLLSVLTLCIPGILENIQQKREIQCDYIVCSYEAVKAGVSPTFCSKEKSFRICKDFVGEVFAFPPMSMLNYVREFVSNILANPIGTAWAYGATEMREIVNACTNCSSVVLGVGLLFLGFTDITAAIQTFQDMTENGFFPDFSSSSSCDKISDIKEELEKVVNEN